MKKNYYTMALMLFSINPIFAIPPNNILKKNTNLIYDVNYKGSNYELTVTINKLAKNSQEYKWKMTGPQTTEGVLNLNEETINNAEGVVHFFQEGAIDMTNQCAFFLSKKIFNDFKNSNTSLISTDIEKKKKNIFYFPVKHTQSFQYNNDIFKEFNCITVMGQDNSDLQITYVDDAEFPLIVKLEVDWILKLKSIYSK